MFLTFQSEAHDQGHGIVNVSGEIVEAPCSVDVVSRAQTIEMPSQSVISVIKNNSLEREFSIRLVNCTLNSTKQNDEWSSFQVTFDGDRDNNDFGVGGKAHGVALQIRDEEGNVAIPGQPLPKVTMEPGEMQLKYKLRLVGNGGTPSAGLYNSTIRYKLDYY